MYKCSRETVEGAAICLKEHKSGSDTWIGSWGQIISVYILNNQLSLELSQWGPATSRPNDSDVSHRGNLPWDLLLLCFQCATTTVFSRSSHTEAEIQKIDWG